MVKKIVILLLSVKVCLALLLFTTGTADLPEAHAQNTSLDDPAPAFEKDRGDTSQETIRTELIQEFKNKQEELTKKEEELGRREGQLKTIEGNIENKIAELKRLQLKLEELITMRKDVEDENIAALSKTYAAMSAEEAAKRIKVMDRSIALKLLAQMKSKKSAQILSSLDTETATEMTEQLAKRPLE